MSLVLLQPDISRHHNLVHIRYSSSCASVGEDEAHWKGWSFDVNPNFMMILGRNLNFTQELVNGQKPVVREFSRSVD